MRVEIRIGALQFAFGSRIGSDYSDGGPAVQGR
ncbi:hypothetical protein N601_02090 [Rhodococcus erythropolis DN1]|nr:hypothetical protein N601_02090 [Rhodococcus erythropolis DN1]